MWPSAMVHPDRGRRIGHQRARNQWKSGTHRYHQTSCRHFGRDQLVLLFVPKRELNVTKLAKTCEKEEIILEHGNITETKDVLGTWAPK